MQTTHTELLLAEENPITTADIKQSEFSNLAALKASA